VKFITGPVGFHGYRPFVDGLEFSERRRIHEALKAAGLRSMEGQHMFAAFFVYLHKDEDRRRARRIALKAVA
jgi:hypothetical protein